MVGLVQDIKHITTQAFKKAGDLIYLIGETKAEFGGSELQKLVKGRFLVKHQAIDLDVEKERQEQVINSDSSWTC